MNNKQANNNSGPPTWSERLYLEINRKDIAYLKFILESHDNLAIMSVVDKYRSVVQIRYAPRQRCEILNFIQGVSEEISTTLLDFF